MKTKLTTIHQGVCALVLGLVTLSPAPGKLKVDSDTALALAKEEPLLGKLTLKASRLVLERHGMDDATPVWKIRLWAAKLENPKDIADVGEVIISAEDGTVLKSDLKPAHVD